MVPVAMTTGYQGTGGPLTQSDVGLYLFDRRTPALRDHHLYYIFPQNEVDGKFWPHTQATFPSSYMVWVQGSRCGTCICHYTTVCSTLKYRYIFYLLTFFSWKAPPSRSSWDGRWECTADQLEWPSGSCSYGNGSTCSQSEEGVTVPLIV